MSRKIQSIINNALDIDPEYIIGFFNPQKFNKLFNKFENIKLISFEKHNADTLEKLLIIDQNCINHSLSCLPNAVICAWLNHYSFAKNLSITLKIPLINLFDEDLINIKKESIFELSKTQLINDINIVLSDNIAKQLYLKNYSILEQNLEGQLNKLIKQWILK